MPNDKYVLFRLRGEEENKLNKQIATFNYNQLSPSDCLILKDPSSSLRILFYHNYLSWRNQILERDRRKKKKGNWMQLSEIRSFLYTALLVLLLYFEQMNRCNEALIISSLIVL